MKIETIAASEVAAHTLRSSSQGPAVKTEQASGHENQRGAGAVRDNESEEAKVSPSEILDRIKEISQDGYYSVRFEKNMEFDSIVVKIVDRITEEVIREVPPEEILRVKAKLVEFSGNIFNKIS